MSFISFSYLFALAKAYNIMMNRNGKNRRSPCLALSEKVFCMSLSCMILDVGLSYMACILLRYIPSIPDLLRETGGITVVKLDR